LAAHLQFAQANTKTKNCKRATKPAHKDKNEMTKLNTTEKGRRHNSTYPKVAVQWLNQALCFYQSFCLVDNEVLRNRHLRVAAKR
jgi:hypothetical protein